MKAVLLAAAAVAATCLPASAQTEYPNRSVRIINPYVAGSTTDILARGLATGLSIRLGQQFYVDNRPGAGGNVGTEYVAKQPADGHTILVSANTHVVNINFFKKLPYDPIKDFEPITLAVTVQIGRAHV